MTAGLRPSLAGWRRRIASALDHPVLRRLGGSCPRGLRAIASALRARLRGKPSQATWPITPYPDDADFLDRAAVLPQLLEYHRISNLMLMIWQSRLDLQEAFDLANRSGQQRFSDWYVESAKREYGIEPVLFGPPKVQSAVRLRHRSSVKGDAPARLLEGEAGVTLVGHAHGELGLGEDIRMSALALTDAAVPFGIVDFRHGLQSRQNAVVSHGNLIASNRFRVNLIHLNADQLLRAQTQLGRSFFRRRHNIAYLFWELAEFPRIWQTTLQTVDEIWVASSFVRDAIGGSVSTPVHLVPPPLFMPRLPELGRAHFRIDSSDYAFVFSFDALSYIERKNPLAAIRAFRRAFPDGNERVTLIIKAMNAHSDNPGWRAVTAAAAADARIRLINATLDRVALLALVNACDCYLSLHRAEGLGRGPLEAMAMGKPVIATGYSGNLDFTRSDTALLVDHALIPVQPGQYPFHVGQKWADPDTDHAAHLMRQLVADPQQGVDLGKRASELVADQYGRRRCAEAYRRRLVAIANCA